MGENGWEDREWEGRWEKMEGRREEVGREEGENGREDREWEGRREDHPLGERLPAPAIPEQHQQAPLH